MVCVSLPVAGAVAEGAADAGAVGAGVAGTAAAAGAGEAALDAGAFIGTDAAIDTGAAAAAGAGADVAADAGAGLLADAGTGIATDAGAAGAAGAGADAIGAVPGAFDYGAGAGDALAGSASSLDASGLSPVVDQVINGGASSSGSWLSNLASPVTNAWDSVFGSAPTNASSLSSIYSDDPYAADTIGGVVNGGTDASGSSATGLAGAASKVAKGISPTSIGLGALAALGTALSKPKTAAATPGPSSTAATQGPLFNAPLQTTGYVNRTPTSFANEPANYWATYGQGPEQNFFTNNNLNYRRGGALAQTAARGGSSRPQFDSARGDKFVRGSGGGQDDNINARLSPGEWVADANFVSALGDGNNEEGSKRLYAMRQRVMREKGMKKVVPPKLKKSPLQYLKAS